MLDIIRRTVVAVGDLEAWSLRGSGLNICTIGRKVLIKDGEEINMTSSYGPADLTFQVVGTAPITTHIFKLKSPLIL
jgi:hypothetical protein